MTVVRPGSGLDEDAAVAVWQAAQAGLGRRSGGPRAQRVRARLRARDALLLVAERDGDVVGVLLAEIVGGALEVGLLAVAPAAQRSGVGRALLSALLSRYPRAGVRLGPEDDAAHALCTSSGFVPVGTGEDGVRLLRTAP